MNFIPIIIYCAIINGEVSPICTAVENHSKPFTEVECQINTYHLLNNRGARQRALDELTIATPDFDGKVQYKPYCIPRNKLDDFLYNYYNFPRVDEDT